MRIVTLEEHFLIPSLVELSTFRITDAYRKSDGKWVIVQEHISLPPDVARW